MISQIKQKGFTIVELLIVIVVIAILAALSYVGYTSITARANNSTAAASAKAVKDTAQVFHGSHGVWPADKAAMLSGYPAGGDASLAVAKLPTDVLFPTTASAANQYSAASDAGTIQYADQFRSCNNCLQRNHYCSCRRSWTLRTTSSLCRSSSSDGAN